MDGALPSINWQVSTRPSFPSLLGHGNTAGSTYIADSLRLISAELGIALIHTKARDCEAKGVIERLHRSWR